MSDGSVAKESATTSAFRSVSERPHVALNPLSGRPASAMSNSSSSSSSSDNATTLGNKLKSSKRRECNNNGNIDTAPGLGSNEFEWPAVVHHDDKRQLLLDGDDEDVTSDEDSKESEANGLSSQVWMITEEQLTYYKHQFSQLQDELDCPVQGSRAKEFFEKSNLPIAELRAIWQLSDVTRDGCLSIEEFLIAMHLVVLRRNNIEVPSTLPEALQPSVLLKRIERTEDANQCRLQPRRQQQAGERTTSVSGALDSPKPANFDFHRPNATNNPNIVHPVALRASPDTDPNRALTTTSEDEESNRPTTNQAKQVIYEQLCDEHQIEDDNLHDSIDGPKEASESHVVLSGDVFNQRVDGLVQSHGLGRISSSSDSASTEEEEEDDNDKDNDDDSDDEAEDDNDNLNHSSFNRHLGQSMPPPALPLPRPPVPSSSGHARSSSLDLTSRNHRAAVPPTVPPRTSVSQRLRPNQNAQLTIHQYRDKNSVLARTINELHQEVSDILEERISLEFQLEQLKAFGE